MRRLSVLLMGLMLVLVFAPHVAAQTNTLTNPGMEPPYNGSPLRYAANGWNIWVGGGNPDFYPEEFGSVRSGTRSQAILTGFETFTAAVYQTVTTIPAGSQVRASAYAQIFVSGSEQAGATESRMRIGIDPNGGTNPNDGDVVWSGEQHIRNGQSVGDDAWATNYSQVSVTATTTGPSVTVFLWGTQQWAATEHRQFWDDASLVVIEEGDGTVPEGEDGNAEQPSVPVFESSFAVPAGAREDGSIVHTVAEGNTLFAIAVAYGITVDEIRELNPDIGEGRFIRPGQELLIRPPTGASAQTGEDTTEPTAVPTQPPSDEGQGAVPTIPPLQPTLVPTFTPAAPVDPTTAPPAPVEVADAGDTAADVTAVCVNMFDDVNMNRVQEAGENPLQGGTITLLQNGTSVESFVTDGSPTNLCFDNIEAGEYTATASPPAGYGLTTPDQLRVRVVAGTQLNVNFGAAQDASAAQPPPADTGDGLVEETTQDDTQSSSDSEMMENLGMLVFGLAGVVFVGGLVATLLLRQ